MQLPFIYQALLGAFFSATLFFLLFQLLVMGIIKLFRLKPFQPIRIITICLILLITYIVGSIYTFYRFLSGAIPTTNFLSSEMYSLLPIILYISIWKMKKWALWGLVTLTVFQQGIAIYNHSWTPMLLILFYPIFVILTCYDQLN